jgi:hypothetical protein
MFLPMLYSAPGTISDLVNATIHFEKVIPFITLGSIQFNHSFTALASLATDGIFQRIPFPHERYTIIGILIKIFIVSTLLIPLLGVLTKKTFTRMRQNILWVIRERKNQRLTLLCIVYVLAAVNLLPLLSFNYRLYYSLPVLFFLYIESKSHSYARWNTILSMIFLGLKGFWILMSIEPKGMTLFDIRSTNIFVLFHFFFMIKAALALIFRAQPASKKPGS